MISRSGGIKIDVKACRQQHGHVLAPARQVRKSQADIYLWIYLDRFLQTGHLLGWAWQEEVLKAQLWKDLKLPAFAVKIETLHPMSELEELLND